MIALLTDFGLRDSYVAEMKMVLMARCAAPLVDITHQIPPQDITAAELCLRRTMLMLPEGGVTVVVVDPGVGTERRGIAISYRGRFFVGPDNGVLGSVAYAPEAETVTLDRPEFFAYQPANTFHGRDVFSPVAATLWGGLPVTELGNRCDDAKPSTIPKPTQHVNGQAGCTLRPDHFGNLLTNLSKPDRDFSCDVGATSVPVVHTYGVLEPGQLGALVGSDGYVELAVRDGSAAEHLGEGPHQVTLTCR